MKASEWTKIGWRMGQSGDALMRYGALLAKIGEQLAAAQDMAERRRWVTIADDLDEAISDETNRANDAFLDAWGKVGRRRAKGTKVLTPEELQEMGAAK